MSKNIITKTFKVMQRGIELRVYVAWFPACDAEQVTLEVGVEMDSAIGGGEHVSDKYITICSNRAGLHFAYYWQAEGNQFANQISIATDPRYADIVACRDKFAATLKAAGWKESQGN